jgi:hypothetical protein
VESREGSPSEHVDQAQLQRLREDLVRLSRAWYDGLTPDGEPLTPENRPQAIEAIVEAAIAAAIHEDHLERRQLVPGTESAVRASLDIVDRLRELAERRTYDPSIEVVHVYSGPGTYFDRTKPGQEERQRWMDHDRILAGVAVVREVAAAKIRQLTGVKLNAGQISEDDLIRVSPQLFYNGTPVENQAVQRALSEGRSKVPKTKVVVANDMREDDGSTRAIRHTADQVRSLFQQVDNPKSELHGRRHIAAVAHIPDFIRIPFYLEKHNRARLQSGGSELKFSAFALKSRRGSSEVGGRLDTVGQHTAAELPRLVKYLQRGDLAAEPVRFESL